jgi:hypothetical protein
MITDDDFVEISEWFSSRKWPVPPGGKMLPDTGYVAELDGQLLAVAWLYLTNSNVGIVDWLATNPNAGAKGIIVMKKLLAYIEDISGDSISTFMHFTPNDKLAKFLKRKCGFKVTEKANICVRRKPEVAHG